MNQQIKQRFEQINNGQVPEGYKKTEFGVFPCDWVTKKLDSVCQINPKTNCLPKQFIYLDLESVQDGKIIQKNIINIENAPSRAQRVLSKNDIIYQLVRPYQKNNLFFNVDDEQYPTVASTGYGLLRSKMQNYLFQILHADYFVNQVNVKCTGTNYPAINSDDLGKVLIAFPQSKNEQEKIAEILMKWDEAIELQEKYIEKLKGKKDAIMHKLLVPKPNWKTIKLGDICNIKTGKLNVNDSCETGKYPFFSCSKDVYSIDSFSFDCEALLIAGNGDIGDIKYYKGKFDAYQRTYVLTDFSFDIQYVMQYLLFHFDKEILKGIQKSSMPYIKLNSLKTATIKYDENNYIQVQKYLFEFEKSIALNKSKLDNLCFQRKALQQYLLNGIVRVEV